MTARWISAENPYREEPGGFSHSHIFRSIADIGTILLRTTKRLHRLLESFRMRLLVYDMLITDLCSKYRAEPKLGDLTNPAPPGPPRNDPKPISSLDIRSSDL